MPRPNSILSGLILLLTIALATLLVGSAQPAFSAWPASVPLHLVFALGIMPLIMGAITWFTPALTRSATPERFTLLAPVLGWLAGGVLLYALLQDFRLFPLAGLIALLAVVQLSWWLHQRTDATLGPPHAGLLWYRLALLFLAAGLLAIMAGALLPAEWPALRRLHLHLNTLGFIGLTALGTLRVLLPTCAGVSDPTAVRWLSQSWRWLAAGTLLIAVGAGWSFHLAILGLLFWLPPLFQLLQQLFIPYCPRICTLHGAAPALASACLGLLLTLGSGLLHAVGTLPATSTSLCFVLAFLLPLVTGAATQLLPLWLFAGEQRAQQRSMRQGLGRFGGARGVVFLAAGGLTLFGAELAWLVAAIGLIHFLASIPTSLERQAG